MLADQTACVTCLSQKMNESRSSSNSITPPTTRPCSSGSSATSIINQGEKILLDHALHSCSNLCKDVEITKQYNGIQQPDTDFPFSNSKVVKENQNVKFRDDHSEHDCLCLSQICQSHKSHTHASTIKFNSFDKCNGLTHHHVADEYSSRNDSHLVNVLNMYTREPVSTQIHSSNKDSDWESENSCCCTTKVDSDYVSCDEIETENMHSPEVHCHNDNIGMDTLLTNFERISMHQLNNSNEHYSFSDDVINGITYVVYESEKQMPDIMRLITKDLSEPYSIYTYRYFIHNWPKLCFLALCDSHCVGAIVCKLDSHKKMVQRGYIAMLAVDSEYRRRKIGSILVTKAIEAMIRDDCDEVVLETEITNESALRLYENLGFVRDKRLFRYYLNGVDALRLKLWLR